MFDLKKIIMCAFVISSAECHAVASTTAFAQEAAPAAMIFFAGHLNDSCLLRRVYSRFFLGPIVALWVVALTLALSGAVPNFLLVEWL